MACSLGGCTGLKRRTENLEVAIPFLIFSALVIIPLLLALDRLIYVSDKMPWQVFSSLDEHYLSQGAIGFTFTQALLSTVLTLIIGIPIAWQLGRYNWPKIRLIRALLTLPFVTPAIVAAMGFMAILGSDGLDLRGDKSTYLFSLLFAHAWFNIALVIRFVDPVISNIDPIIEEQLRLLPAGNSLRGRIRWLWFPLMYPSVLCAAVLTFVFSFTSFAMVRWMIPSNATLETVMADVGGAAGIVDYQIFSNELVLASSTIQFIVLIVALWLLSILQAKRNQTISEVSESHSRKRSRMGWMVLAPALAFCLSPLFAVLRASLRVAERGPVITHRWTLDGWKGALGGDYAYISILDALQNSLGYALLTLVIALPLGWSLSSSIHMLEKRGSYWAKPLDVLTMLPLAISGIMLGLGILLGIIRISTVFFTFWWMPAVPHIMIATPFVVRLLLPAMRRQDPLLIENAQVLAMNRWQILTQIRIPLLRGPLIVAGIIAIAMSMGEFGASWILVRTGAWDTLPVLVDQLMSRPGFDPLVKPTAMAAASLLMITTLILFLLAERFRPDGDGGMF